jgi:copper(I)-binding protein
MKLTLLAVLAALLPLAAQAGDVSVSQPWMRFLLPSLPASGYMVVQNNGDTIETLTGASSPACGSLMLHESQDQSGMAMMMMVPSLDIPAHGSVTFAPGGYHLMCMKPAMKIGDKVQVTLMLKQGGDVVFTAPVYGATTAP